DMPQTAICTQPREAFGPGETSHLSSSSRHGQRQSRRLGRALRSRCSGEYSGGGSGSGQRVRGFYGLRAERRHHRFLERRRSRAGEGICPPRSGEPRPLVLPP
ncbi:unnamed protein product, partial [Symbiodinium necroappetens]